MPRVKMKIRSHQQGGGGVETLFYPRTKLAQPAGTCRKRRWNQPTADDVQISQRRSDLSVNDVGISQLPRLNPSKPGAVVPDTFVSQNVFIN